MQALGGRRAALPAATRRRRDRRLLVPVTPPGAHPELPDRDARDHLTAPATGRAPLCPPLSPVLGCRASAWPARSNGSSPAPPGRALRQRSSRAACDQRLVRRGIFPATSPIDSVTPAISEEHVFAGSFGISPDAEADHEELPPSSRKVRRHSSPSRPPTGRTPRRLRRPLISPRPQLHVFVDESMTATARDSRPLARLASDDAAAIPAYRARDPRRRPRARRTARPPAPANH